MDAVFGEFQQKLSIELSLDHSSVTIANILKQLLRKKHDNTYENEIILQQILTTINYFKNTQVDYKWKSRGCCGHHDETRDKIEKLLTSSQNEFLFNKEQIIDIIKLSCFEIDRFETFKDFYKSTANDPTLNTKEFSKNQPIPLVRFIGVNNFIANYFPKIPTDIARLKFKKFLAHALKSNKRDFNHPLEAGIENSEEAKGRWERLERHPYGKLRGYWGAHLDKKACPIFSKHCRHATSFCTLLGKIYKDNDYLEMNIVSLYKKLGLYEAKGDVIEARYSVPRYQEEDNTGFRIPHFIDSEGYLHWASYGETRSLSDQFGVSEYVHPPFKIEQGKIDFIYWPNKGSDIKNWHEYE